MSDERRPDEIAELIQLAGRRPEIPAERVARVRAVVREHWLAEVRRRRTRRTWAAASLAAAALIVLAIGLWDSLGPGDGEVARVQAVMGAVRIDGRPLVVGDVVPVGSEMVTGAGGRAALAMSSGQSLRIDEDSEIRLKARAAIDLRRGAVYADSGARPASGSRALAVVTPAGEVREIGTQFEVRRTDGTVLVRVREGRVSLEGGGKVLEVEAGTELAVDDAGRTSRQEITTHGADWNWITLVTPPLDLENRPLLDFLGWVGRETGWKVAYADEATARAVPEIVLDGTVAGLTPAEALDAVLPTCRMTHSVEDGVLTIRRSPEAASE